MAEPVLTISYTNWRGETATRRIRPRNFWYGITSWHPQHQWFLHADDVDRGVARDFAVSGIKGFPSPDAAAPRHEVAGMLDAAMRDKIQLAKLGGK